MPYLVAAVFSLESGHILTWTLAGFAAALTILPVAGLRTKVSALRAGTSRRITRAHFIGDLQAASQHFPYGEDNRCGRNVGDRF